MVAQIVTAIIALAKTVPVIDGWLRQLNDAYVSWQISKIDTDRITKQDKISVIMNQIKKAEGLNEKAALLASLTDIKRLL